MTEAEWIRHKEPEWLLSCLRHQRKARKRRLFASACCRRIWQLLRDDRSRQAVEIAERFADDLASERKLTDAHAAAVQTAREANAALMDVPLDQRTSPWKVWKAAEAAVHAVARRGTVDAAYDAHLASYVDLKQSVEERRAQSELLRCIFGNPFRVIEIRNNWLTWRDGTVPKIAQTIYDDRTFVDLPILADALEEAGCDNADILAHCRSGGEHVRGCWVVDLLLEKN